MHNLYLGTGKHAFKVWISENVLTKDNLAEIDRKVRPFSSTKWCRQVAYKCPTMVDLRLSNGEHGSQYTLQYF